MKPSDIIATIGVSLLLLSFFLQFAKLIKTESYTYALLNLFGAAIAGYASWIISFYPFIILEGFWCLVALLSILKLLKKQSVPRETL